MRHFMWKTAKAKEGMGVLKCCMPLIRNDFSWKVNNWEWFLWKVSNMLSSNEQLPFQIFSETCFCESRYHQIIQALFQPVQARAQLSFSISCRYRGERCHSLRLYYIHKIIRTPCAPEERPVLTSSHCSLGFLQCHRQWPRGENRRNPVTPYTIIKNITHDNGD